MFPADELANPPMPSETFTAQSGKGITEHSSSLGSRFTVIQLLVGSSWVASVV